MIILVIYHQLQLLLISIISIIIMKIKYYMTMLAQHPALLTVHKGPCYVQGFGEHLSQTQSARHRGGEGGEGCGWSKVVLELRVGH